MPEPVDVWWSRRQRSKGIEVPYRVGHYRHDWQQYPVLVRQYHPDLNHGLTLSQVPPAADVYLVWQCDAGHTFVATPFEQRQRPGRSRRRSTWCPECAALAVRSRTPRPAKPPLVLCEKSDAARQRIGEAFRSACAPRPASAVESDLRQRIGARLQLDLGFNAVRVARPFFDHLEVWPDIVLAELKVAIEYDSSGRDGLEHLGRREATDKRKDRALRSTGWEVIRIRTGKLRPIGPYDMATSAVSDQVVDRILDRLRDIRGALIVDCYLVDCYLK